MTAQDGAAAPGQAAYAGVPAAFSRWCRTDDVTVPDFAILTMWRSTTTAKRAFWTGDGAVAAAAAAQPGVHMAAGFAFGAAGDLAGLKAAAAAQPAPGDALNAAYRERARLVAFLTAVYPSVIAPAPDADGWAIVYVQAPTGQMSWHIAYSDLDLFGHLKMGDPAEWDGHTTDEKYERLATLIPHALDIRHEAAPAAPAAAPELAKLREALQQAAKHIDSEHAQLRIVARIARRALEGK